MKPLEIWLDNPDTIVLRTESGIIQLPCNEPGRLIAFLRNEFARQQPVREVAQWRNGWGRAFDIKDEDSEAWELAVRKAGAARRAELEARKANNREVRAHREAKKLAKQKLSKEAELFMKEMGL